MDFEALLFDMDGLMLDTERISDELFAAAGPRFGVSIGPAEMALLRGVTHEAGRAAFAKRFGPDFPYDALLDDVHKGLFARVEAEKPLKPGLLALLDACDGRGIRCAVASSSSRFIVEHHLAATGLAGRFGAVVCGDGVARSKPAPDIYLAAARALGADIARCMVLEDSYNGVRAGAAAGAATVMVPDLSAPTGEMRALAWRIVPSLRQVIPLLGLCGEKKA